MFRIWSLIPSAFLLVNMCVYQVRRLSRWIPRYFVSSCGIRIEFKVSGGHLSCFKVNVTCTDFISFALIRLSASLSAILTRYSDRFESGMTYLLENCERIGLLCRQQIFISSDCGKGRSLV